MNLKTQEGQDLVRQLVKDADVLVSAHHDNAAQVLTVIAPEIENYVPGKLDEMRLGYKDCQDLNPRLIYASITGYGQSGPFRDQPGYDARCSLH